MFALWRLKVLKRLFQTIKDIFVYPKELKDMQQKALETNRIYQTAIDKVKSAPKKTPTRRKAVAKTGLYSNIHAKQERIKAQKAAGKPAETMRKPGAKGAPTAKNFKEAAKTAKK